MKTFSNSNARSPQDASNRSAQARKAGRTAVFAGGGSDVLQLVKERIVQPDVIVNLKTMANLNQVTKSAAGVGIGGQTTLDTISRDDSLRKDYTVLAEAAGSAATPQIRNVGTIAGNVCQRPCRTDGRYSWDRRRRSRGTDSRRRTSSRCCRRS